MTMSVMHLAAKRAAILEIGQRLRARIRKAGIGRDRVDQLVACHAQEHGLHLVADCFDDRARDLLDRLSTADSRSQRPHL